ncbi:hypothetical protein [Nocardia sp. NPDC052566]|uniref:hypothetical protein n=1 Tax=Nocardia sp. NPDC052566 TaxID=3364330 RepID=UPI0037C93F40
MFEIGDDGWVCRQVDLQGPELRPVTAAALDEVMFARDNEGIAAVQAYERKYGVVTDGNTADWDPGPDALTQVTAAEFERAWVHARRAIEGSN